jgi:hypothetical protein
MRKKITMKKEELQSLYLEKKNKDVCKLLGVTMPTLLLALRRARIELKGSGNKNPKSIIQIVK